MSKNRSTHRPKKSLVASCAALVLLSSSQSTPVTDAFAPSRVISSHGYTSSATCGPLQAVSADDDISKAVERARELLEKSKAKLEKASAEKEEKESEKNNDVDTPFFASTLNESGDSEKREQVVKHRDEKTGLITTDGEKMAKMSEDEQWEVRSLMEVFESELEETDDIYSMVSKQLGERDVAASIYNLRKQMQMEDYRKIFDKTNRFIGEDN